MPFPFNILMLGVDDSDGNQFKIATTNLGAGEDRLVIDSSGNVSIPDLVSCSAISSDASGQLSCSAGGRFLNRLLLIASFNIS